MMTEATALTQTSPSGILFLSLCIEFDSQKGICLIKLERHALFTLSTSCLTSAGFHKLLLGVEGRESEVGHRKCDEETPKSLSPSGVQGAKPNIVTYGADNFHRDVLHVEAGSGVQAAEKGCSTRWQARSRWTVATTFQVDRRADCLANCSVSPVCDSYNYRSADRTCQLNTHDTPSPRRRHPVRRGCDQSTRTTHRSSPTRPTLSTTATGPGSARTSLKSSKPLENVTCAVV